MPDTDDWKERSAMRPLVLVIALVAVVTACGGGQDEPETTQVVETGQVPFDLAFIDAMVPHHEDAIVMAQAALRRGMTEPELEKIAKDVISTQRGEIDQLLDWREQWFGSRAVGPIIASVLGVPEDQLGMDHGAVGEIARAADVGRTFATLMTEHHRGAIVMADAAEGRAQHNELKDLAEAIAVAQEREIEIMEPHASGEHHG